MWEYFLILFLSIVDMVTGQSSFNPILTKSSLQSAVNSWCKSSGTTEQKNVQFTTSGGCSTSIAGNICFGPIAGKSSFSIFSHNLFDQHLSNLSIYVSIYKFLILHSKKKIINLQNNV